MLRKWVVSAVLASLFTALLPEAAAASPGIAIKGLADEVVCHAPIEEKTVGGPFMVGARTYAQCIHAAYHWDPETREFWLERPTRIDSFSYARVRLSFNLTTAKAVAYVDGDPADVYDLDALGMQVYERQGDLANMIPLRFTNDLFDLGSSWRSDYNYWYTFLGESNAYAPAWDRQKIPSRLSLLDRYGSPTQPETGWDMLPSTVRELRDYAAFGLELENRAQRYQVPYLQDWENLRMVYLDSWGGQPILELSKDHGHYVTTRWWHSYADAKNELKRLQDSKAGWDAYNGFLTVAGLAATAVTAYISLPVAGPLGALSALFGAAYMTASAEYTFAISDMETCFDIADEYRSNADTPFSMGLRAGPGGSVTCRDHFQQP